MDTLKSFEEIGFSRNEAAVYTSLLKLGPSPVLGISRDTNLKRPTLYLILDDLMEKGLVSLVPGEKKRVYMALSPEWIAEKLKRGLDTFHELLPHLLATWKTESARPAVRLFESKEGMLNVYREIARSKEIKEVRTFFSFEAIPKEFAENYELFIKLLKERKVSEWDLVSSDSPRHFYLEQTRKLPNHKARIIPSGQKFFSDTIIYGTNVAIFSFKKKFALIIESKEVADSFKTLFDLAWESGKEM